MMVSIGLLGLMMIVLSGAVSTVSQAWTKGLGRVDGISQARTALSLVQRDLQSIVLRREVPAFVDDVGKPAFAFYTEVNTGSNSKRRLSLVQYFMSNTNPAVVRRACLAVNFPTGSNPANTSLINASGSVPTIPGVAEFHPSVTAPAEATNLGEGIVKFSWQYVTADGRFSDAFSYNYNDPGDPANSRAVVVSLLVLNSSGLQIARATGTLPVLLSAFSGSPQADQTWCNKWNSAMESPGFGNGLPVPVHSGLRAFELYIPLSHALTTH
ncbi:MAG TPA: hypothetical protein VK970_17665 [Candidatus Methylacidiphilales bacterium]|nr:hypothetical protein [Candidatus Methylacidiphilales bacterium]